MSNIPDNILRDGTSQKLRDTKAVDPDKVLVDGRDMEYYLRYIAKMASKICFYNSANMPDGNWESFFPEEPEISKYMAKLTTGKDLPPQQALFLAFVRLMGILKGDINKLSKQHLNFYYKDVLRFQPLKSIAEKVNIVFEPVQNLSEPVVLSAGLELLAGKSDKGSPIIFRTDKETTISKVSLERVSSILVDESSQSRVYSAPRADSADGISAPLPKDCPFWYPFGESQSGKQASERTMVDGKTGFAIASQVFLLKAGKRDITITLKCLNLRLTDIHFDSLVTSGTVPAAVTDQLQAVKNILFRSTDEIQEAIITAIGGDNFSLYGPDIFEYISQPFKAIKDIDLEKAFVAEATGEKGWFPVNSLIISRQVENELRFQLSLDPMDPGIVDFDSLVHQVVFDTTSPVIQLVLNHSNSTYLYNHLRGLIIKNVNVEVVVKGLTNIVLQTENGPANPVQAFLPFGAMPASGSAFYFGGREVFSKKLNSLQIELSWANLPKDKQGFEDYYAEYPDALINESFTTKFSVLDKGIWVSAATAENVILFRTKTVGVDPGTHPLIQDIYFIELPLPALEEAVLQDFTAFDPDAKHGFGRLVLNDPDFGHGIFPKVYSEKAIIKATKNPAQALPNTPYTPKISHFAINYSASTAITPSESADSTGNQILQVEPFGLVPFNENTTGNLLPQFPQGSLYIGLANLTPPQNISFLFQMVDGTANPDIEVSRNDVKWNYFSRTKWKEFSDVSIQLDTTYGLQTSGVLEFSIPDDASDDAVFWPKGLFWIRAIFKRDPSGAGQMTGILPNAMTATLREDLVKEGILKDPLQPDSVSRLVIANPLIKTVRQPYSSFGGKGTEPESGFYKRVSERLRHKNRAVSIWDYEHLVLEAFPSIYKVKCLPHTGHPVEAEPGSVTLIVIPDLRKRNKINPFEPKVSAVVREQIAAFLNNLKSVFSRVYVDNPKYEQVLVEMSVGLIPGFDGSFYGKLLNEELKRFLSPWAYEEGKDIVFGGKIFKSSILAFVEQREYVDYVTDFRLYHIRRGYGIGDMKIRDDIIEGPADFIVRPDTIGEETDYEVVASSPRSILVTAQNHNITILNPGEYVCPEPGADSGIGAMIIEVDFLVS